MVIGGELEVHESTTETETTAEPFVPLGLLEAREKRSMQLLKERGIGRLSLLSGNILKINGRRPLLSGLVERHL